MDTTVDGILAFAYTTDGDCGVEHRRKLGSGGSADVHEVCSCQLSLMQMYRVSTGEVWLSSDEC
jgi:hypothetical protein